MLINARCIGFPENIDPNTNVNESARPGNGFEWRKLPGNILTTSSDRNDARRLLSGCNISGPRFIVEGH